jgi:hypothetical protein
MGTDLAKIAEELETLLNAHALLDEEALEARARALDSLEFAQEALSRHAKRRPEDPVPAHLLAQAQRLAGRLRHVDRTLFAKVRRRIASGELSGPALRALFDKYTPYEPSRATHLHLSFDALDVLVAGVLHEAAPPRPTHPLEDEMIAFQPSPISAVLELVDRAAIGPEDVFYDLGAGLGDVAVTLVLLTGATARGVEIDPSLCAYARTGARSLGLTNVTFINADVRALDYDAGTVFYLFTPFVGDHLATVMAKLERVSQAHRIVVGTYGPITPIVANLPWLRSLNDHRDDPFRLAVLQSL